MEYNPSIAKVCSHPYYWLARFGDGEEVAQYKANGEEVLYREVLDRLEHGKGLSSVAWVSVKTGKPCFTLSLRPWQRPIVLRRHFDTTNIVAGRLTKKTIFLLGWQATIGGKNYKTILFIDPELGEVRVSDEM